MTFETAWLVSAIVIVGCFAGLGVWISRHPLGILIDGRNKMSLSRLQLVLWTVLLISAFTAVALVFQTSDITLPQEVWALMGISVGSTAGSVIVKGTKDSVLDTNEDMKGASLKDLFKGEEHGADCQHVDITKVQMFFFTAAV